MRWFYKFHLRPRSIFRKSRVEQELTDELHFHLQKLIDENVAKGMASEDARYAALHELGGVEQVKQDCRGGRCPGKVQVDCSASTHSTRVRYGRLQHFLSAVTFWWGSG